MLTTSTLHSPGFWDHMPPAHELHIVMNDETTDGAWAEPLAEQTLPARRARRSHSNAWILGLAVSATGAAVAVAVANGHDPRGLGSKLNAMVADVESVGHHDAEAPADATPATPTTTAQAPQETPAVTTPTTPPAQEGSKLASAASDTPLPSISPQAGRSTSNNKISPTAPVAAPKQPAPQQLATLSTPNATQELRETPLPVEPPAQMAPVSPVTPISPINPITPVTPVTQPIVVPPLAVPAAPPASAPASAPSAVQTANTNAASGEATGQ